MDNEMEILVRNLKASMYIQRKTNERLHRSDTIEAIILTGLFIIALAVCSYLY